MEKVIVAGKELELSLMKKEELKSVPIDTKLRFQFYRSRFNDYEFCLLEPKKDENHAPTKCLNLATRLESMIGLPIVYLFQGLQFVERNRLIDRGVYFIVSGKYAFLPFLVLNTREKEQKKSEELSAVAQYILLYHLQVECLEGASMVELEKKLPYTYVTISRAFKTLDDLKLCAITTDENRIKRLHFEESPKELWERVLPLLKSPVSRILYLDSIADGINMTYGGITALSHYTHLNPDEMYTCVIDTKRYRELQAAGAFKNLNESEGVIRLEVWNYPSLSQDYADPISLYLTLMEDKDPRVEKELELMISKIW